jgi:hypothetical protein
MNVFQCTLEHLDLLSMLGLEKRKLAHINFVNRTLRYLKKCAENKTYARIGERKEKLSESELSQRAPSVEV